eukprot:CAMPEP_0181110840 /NCGR_PEP_ID=MMETSP1071-20121207/18939_1 /TAXON_ID=35127 /ORGANISM="Thalassiosira sp., Strain NH16" /LENGTH=146 /DNA_ID=CAMNT_0023194659 /DNA_START=138 /DNA_END=574 /DNA_ORIENTATION=+
MKVSQLIATATLLVAASVDAGTNKTLAPTPGVMRPGTPPPITPFPTEADIPPPVPPPTRRPTRPNTPVAPPNSNFPPAMSVPRLEYFGKSGKAKSGKDSKGGKKLSGYGSKDDGYGGHSGKSGKGSDSKSGKGASGYGGGYGSGKS